MGDQPNPEGWQRHLWGAVHYRLRCDGRPLHAREAASVPEGNTVLPVGPDQGHGVEPAFLWYPCVSRCESKR
jgi:hypothetical protein